MSQVVAPEVGKKYVVRHERFGKATVKVKALDTEWAYCEIISGTLRGIGDWRPGESKYLRRSHCYWFETP